ncbi:tripartite tricarboxylate transporter TctB family protein [Paenibacillus chitinolyticus]|uniref:tripartite tricarboxylate transporter TctB family protein n=1 Tax=Paenibacillus chitinolyticus TaxID=79263 RepID=UPI002DBE6369|nr:tripartite tricarboxylate transporter TctB family protein [Paenibacillus chitinolyticus]MEC0247443.1 tripartite tricarboxylate transporter TctB family protein [Paenibacillus chitinolyticus]
MNKTFDRYAGIVFLLIGAVFAWQSTTILDSAYGSAVGSNLFPLGLGVILVLLSIRLLTETLRYKEEKSEKTRLDYKRFFIILTAAAAYCLLLEPLGYVITTFAFLLTGFQTMERGKWVKSILISAIFSVGVYVLFVQVLRGSLPPLPDWMGF